MDRPTPEEIRADVEATLVAFRKKALAAVDKGDRAASLTVARGFRELWASAVEYAEPIQERIRAVMEETRGKVVEVLGTAAWDEPAPVPERVSGTSVGFAPKAARSFAVADLDKLTEEIIHGDGFYLQDRIDQDTVLELIADLRRLRSDEWLERAADDIVRSVASQLGATEADDFAESIPVVDILRKHRDGGA